MIKTTTKTRYFAIFSDVLLHFNTHRHTSQHYLKQYDCPTSSPRWCSYSSGSLHFAVLSFAMRPYEKNKVRFYSRLVKTLKFFYATVAHWKKHFKAPRFGPWVRGHPCTGGSAGPVYSNPTVSDAGTAHDNVVIVISAAKLNVVVMRHSTRHDNDIAIY